MGRPGRTPNTRAPLMRGALPSGGVSMPSCGVGAAQSMLAEMAAVQQQVFTIFICAFLSISQRMPLYHI